MSGLGMSASGIGFMYVGQGGDVSGGVGDVGVGGGVGDAGAG